MAKGSAGGNSGGDSKGKGSPDNRLTAWKFGQASETVAAFYLRLKGYSIVSRQYRTPLGEIDIVARRGNQLVFVEVKARSRRDDAAAAITPRQQQRIMRAAQLFMQNNPRNALCDMRFDAVLVSPWRWPVHIIDAWRG